MSSGSSLAGEHPSRLVRKIQTHLDGDGELSLSQHAKACNYMARLRVCINDNGPLKGEARGQLMCVGISTWRRSRLGEGVDEDHAALLQRTCALLFVILAMSEMASQLQRASGDVEKVISSSQAAEVDLLLEKSDRATLWELVRPRRRVKKSSQKAVNYDTEADDPSYDGPNDAEVVLVSGDEDDDIRAGTGEHASASARKRSRVIWSDALKITSGDLARASLMQGMRQLQTDVFGPLDRLASNFFRYSATQFSESLLMPQGDSDFVTLGGEQSLRISPGQRAERLFNIVQNAESEAGQFVTRDLLLSFWLPIGIVGLRRTLLLSRAASTKAGVEHPEITQRAHEVAMQGAEWTWQNSKSEAERMSVLLAGVAVMTTRGKPGEADGIRKGDAFGGRVQIPCFETPMPEGGMRLALIPHAKRWILYKIASNGMPHVLCSQTGFEGCCTCVLQLCHTGS